MGEVSKYTKKAKTWRYRLMTSTGTITLEKNPQGWDDKQLTLARNETYLGLFRSFSAELQYITKGGYDELKAEEELNGILGDARLYVDKFDTVKYSYSEVFNAPFDFSEYTESSENKGTIKVPLVDSSFQEKLKSRENIDIPVDRYRDLDDNYIDAIEYRDIELLGREFGGITQGEFYIETASEGDTVNIYDFTGGFPFSMGIRFPNVDILPYFQNTSKTQQTALPTQDRFTKQDCFYYQDIGTGSLSIKLRIKGTTDKGFFLKVWKYLFDSSGKRIIGESELLIDFDSSKNNVDTTLTAVTSTVQDEGIYVEIFNTSDVGSFTVEPEMTISVNYYSEFEPTPCKVVLPFEAFDYMATAITGETGSFRSKYFGREDLGYDEDGEGAYIALTKGLLIRQFPTGYQQAEGEDRKAQLSFKFRELFEAYFKLRNIAIEVIQEDGKYIIVAEPQTDFYSYEVSHTVNRLDLEKDSFERVRNNVVQYSDIEVGYQLADDDLFGGLEEYNNRETYNTVISNNQNKYDLLNTYSASGVQIEKLRRLPFNAYGADEVTGDKSIYFIELWKDGDDLVQRNEQGFEEINGLDGLETKINLGLTPKQSLIAHGENINICLQKYSNSKIKYNTSDKVTDLSFIRDSEEGLIVENGDVISGALDNPKLSGFIINYSAPISFETFVTLRNNPRNIIEVWSPLDNKYVYGWIKEVSTEPTERTTNWQLLEANPPDVVAQKVLATNNDEIIVTDQNEGIKVN